MILKHIHSILTFIFTEHVFYYNKNTSFLSIINIFKTNTKMPSCSANTIKIRINYPQFCVGNIEKLELEVTDIIFCKIVIIFAAYNFKLFLL